jgi:hypothetical protein
MSRWLCQLSYGPLFCHSFIIPYINLPVKRDPLAREDSYHLPDEVSDVLRAESVCLILGTLALAT